MKDAYGSAVFSGGRLASRFPGFPICTADGCVRFLTNTGERCARSAPRRNDARLDTSVRHHKSTPQHKPNSIMTSEENPTRQFDDVSAYWVRQEGASEDYYAWNGRGIAWGRCRMCVGKGNVAEFQRSQVGALRLWRRGIKKTMTGAEVEAGTFEHAGCVLLVEI